MYLYTLVCLVFNIFLLLNLFIQIIKETGEKFHLEILKKMFTFDNDTLKCLQFILHTCICLDLIETFIPILTPEVTHTVECGVVQAHRG